jgi:hypothetical protein
MWWANRLEQVLVQVPIEYEVGFVTVSQTVLFTRATGSTIWFYPEQVLQLVRVQVPFC